MENLLLVYQVLIDLLLCTQGGGAKQNCQEPWPHGAAILEDGAEINKRVNNLTLHGAVLGGEWSRAVGQEGAWGQSSFSRLTGQGSFLRGGAFELKREKE